MNDLADQHIGGDMYSLYHYIYQPFSYADYSVGDVGPNRNYALVAPYDDTLHTWSYYIAPQLTNYFISDFCDAQSHGAGGFIGGGDYLTNELTTAQLAGYVAQAQDPLHHQWQSDSGDTAFDCLGLPT